MTPNLDIDQLKTFLAIVDTGTYTRAGEETNKTQSAVSMQMKRLEETLGRPLFVKDGRGIRLTADGERLIEYARKLVLLSDEAVSYFTKPDIAGTVRFGTPDDYADIFLPEILARFHRTHPSVNVEVECHPSDILAERIRNSELDVAAVTFNGGDVYGEALTSAELVWVTSQRHATHAMDVLPVAAASSSCSWRKLVEDALNRITRSYRIAYISPNFSTIQACVQQGLAVSAMPMICVKPGMRVLTEAEGFPRLGAFDIGLMQRPGKLSRGAQALAQHVRESLSSKGMNTRLMAAE